MIFCLLWTSIIDELFFSIFVIYYVYMLKSIATYVGCTNDLKKNHSVEPNLLEEIP